MHATLDKLAELRSVAVEDVDVHVALDAVHAPVGCQLPVDQSHVGLVLPVAGYPDVVALLDVVGAAHVAVDERLTDVENGAHAGTSLHILQKDAYAAHQHLVAANAPYVGIRRLHVEHRWEVALPEQRVVDEVAGLQLGRRLEREEVVGTHADALALGLGVIAQEVAVADGGALGRLDVEERHGERAPLGVVAATQRRDAQPGEVDGVATAPLLVLVTGDVDAVDALGGILHLLSKVVPHLPFANAQLVVGRRVEPEAVHAVVVPESVFVASVPFVHDALTACLIVGIHLSAVYTGGVDADGCDHRVGVKECRNDTPLVVAHDAVPLQRPHGEVPCLPVAAHGLDGYHGALAGWNVATLGGLGSLDRAVCRILQPAVFFLKSAVVASHQGVAVVGDVMHAEVVVHLLYLLLYIVQGRLYAVWVDWLAVANLKLVGDVRGDERLVGGERTEREEHHHHHQYEKVSETGYRVQLPHRGASSSSQ